MRSLVRRALPWALSAGAGLLAASGYHLARGGEARAVYRAVVADELAHNPNLGAPVCLAEKAVGAVPDLARLARSVPGAREACSDAGYTLRLGPAQLSPDGREVRIEVDVEVAPAFSEGDAVRLRRGAKGWEVVERELLWIT